MPPSYRQAKFLVLRRQGRGGERVRPAQFDDLYRLVKTSPTSVDYAPQSDKKTSGSGIDSWTVDADFHETLKPGVQGTLLVLTGFGSRVNSDCHVTRIGVQVTDINSWNAYYAAKETFPNSI